MGMRSTEPFEAERSQCSFLRGGGRAGELIRSIDWSTTALGAPETWPNALKTTLSTMLHCQQPMFLWWGPELIQFYNDASLPSIGNDKHPRAMGQRAEDCWPELWRGIEPQIREVMQHGIPCRHEIHGYSPVLDDKQERVAGTLVVCHDLLRKQSELERHLLGIVSHDLRTPLQVITLGATVLAEQLHASPVLERVQAAARRAARLVEDLLDFTQARLGGGLPIQPRPIALRDVVTSVTREFCTAHPRRVISVEQHGNDFGMWDPDRIAQLLLNLVSNAHQYGSASEPISIAIRDAADCALLEVSNQGTPIAAEQLPGLFLPMQRGAKASGDRSIGLGLYIVDEIAKGHGGSVAVSSSERAGTTFSVRLPR